MQSRTKRVLRGEKTYDRFLLSLGVVLRFGSCLTVLMTRCVLFFHIIREFYRFLLTEDEPRKNYFFPFLF